MILSGLRWAFLLHMLSIGVTHVAALSCELGWGWNVQDGLAHTSGSRCWLLAGASQVFSL